MRGNGGSQSEYLRKRGKEDIGKRSGMSTRKEKRGIEYEERNVRYYGNRGRDKIGISQKKNEEGKLEGRRGKWRADVSDGFRHLQNFLFKDFQEGNHHKTKANAKS